MDKYAQLVNDLLDFPNDDCLNSWCLSEVLAINIKNGRLLGFGYKRNEETKPATLQQTPFQAIFYALEKVEFNKTNG